jgi:hypothetical protein
MRGHTYSLYARTTGTYRFVACEGSVISASPSNRTITQLPGQVFKSSRSGASCSLYTFVATQNNTILDYTLCYTTASGAAFTHSLIFNNGDLGFICSATAVNLVSGAYTDFNFKTQPESPCDCGTNPPTTTTTITTSTTTILTLTQSWRLERDICCSRIPNTFTFANVNTVTYGSSLLPGNYTFLQVGSDIYCYRFVNQVVYPQVNPQRYFTFNSTIYQNCTDCQNAGPGLPLISGIYGCPSTTTTTTTLSPFNPGVINCPCGQFQCQHYIVNGLVGDSIRWRECTQSVVTGGIRNFNFYYFYEDGQIEFCSCSDAVEIVSVNKSSGTIDINNDQYSLGQIPTSRTNCTRVGRCKSTFIEIAENLRLEGQGGDRPIRVDFDPCFEPDGGWAGYPRVTMWPVTGGVTFSGLPVPLPFWAPQPMSGVIFGRKTHLYTICAIDNSPDKPTSDPNWIGPTISYWDEGAQRWINSSRSSTQPPDDYGYYAWESCNLGTCSCESYTSCPTTTTTLIPCPNCRPTVIGASGSGYTQITYEGCDTLQRNLINIKTDVILFRGVTTSICACERCRQVRIRPTGDGGLFSYKHCCDPPMSAAGATPPPWHESSIDLISRTCRTFVLNSSGTTVFQYVDCRDSRLKYISIIGAADTPVCAATVSSFSGSSGTITSGTVCGTASAELCISRDHYGPTFFGDATDNGFTFSNIGSCSCITSDNRYNPYMYNNRFWNNPLSVRGPSIEWLFVTVSSMAATCSDKTISPNLPQTGGIPGCCNCVVYEMSLTAGDIINYKPCATNRDYSNTILNVQAPQITLPGPTAQAGSFSYRIQASGFYDIGSMSIVINHNNLVVYTASILPAALASGGQLSVLGTFSRFAWSGVSGFFQSTNGPIDILNFTFAMTGPQGAARIEIYTSSTGGFYSFSNFRNTSGLTMSPNYYDGWIKFQGFNLPPSQKNSTPPNWPTFP